MDERSTFPEKTSDTSSGKLNGLNPGPEPLDAAQMEEIRRRREAAKQKERLAADHLKAAQHEADAQKVTQGDGAPSVGETVRSIGGIFGAASRVIINALDSVRHIHPFAPLILVAVVALVIVAPTVRGSISGTLESIGSNIAGLWDTYITQPAERNANKTPTAIDKVSLTSAVNIGRITDASTTYAGLAVKTNDKGEEVCHIYYETTVSAYVETSEIDFVIDDEHKTVTPSLPDQQIEVDTPSTSSIAYFEQNPGVSSDDALSLCDADAKADASDNQGLITCGQENLKKTIEALIEPIISGTDYEISW